MYFTDTSDDGLLKVANVSGEVWMLETYSNHALHNGAVKRRHYLGDFQLTSPNVQMTTQILNNNMVFAGVVKRSRRCLKMWAIKRHEGKGIYN